jgi:DNA-binding transcriptional MocR family regulator
MTLSLHIDREDRRPLYQQIAAQIKNQISVGRLPPGTRLPPVRRLAESLQVNRLTAHNAYSELQADGWVQSTVGKGTYVIEQAQPLTLLSAMSNDFSAESVLQDINPIKQIPTLRSLAYSEPDTTLAPIDDYWGSMMALRREAAALMRYESPEGDPALCVELALFLNERGVNAMPDDILTTSGAMQGLSLTTQALTQRGDTVLVEEPMYLGLIHILKTYGIRTIPVPRDEEGPDLNVIERALVSDQPRLFYTIANFHNPTGLCMSPKRRRDLLDLAARYRLPIVEDDIYGMIAYDSPPPPALKSLDRADTVIYISSVSKMLMPGLRVGYIVPPAYLRNRILSLRRAADLYGAVFTQRALANFLHQGRLKAHLRRVIPIYRERRDAFLQALRHYMPPGVTWTHPSGGFSNWVTLPQANMRTIYQAALQRGVAFTPGTAFMVGGDTNRHMRLCFGMHPAEDLDAIVAMLGEIIAEHTDRHMPETDDALYAPLA